MSDRQYIVLRRSDDEGYVLSFTSSDPYDDDSVKSDDQMLQRTLSKIFSERRPDSAAGQIKELCGPKRLDGQNSIFDLILEQEPAFGKILLKGSKQSLLWIAVLSCYQDSAELLVRSGADVNERYGLAVVSQYHQFRLDEESTLLHALLQMYPSAWNERLIGLLLDRGGDFEARDSRGCTALHKAVSCNGRAKEAETLLERGADVNAVNRSGDTPLLAAATYSHDELMLPLLLRYGADVTARDNNGGSILRNLVCLPVDYVALARVLIEKGASPREAIDAKESQAIHVAVKIHQVELANLYLDHGATVNARQSGEDGAFPLYLAVKYCTTPEMLLTLLRRGASIGMKTNSGLTALHAFGLQITCFRTNDENEVLEMIKILLSAGADMFAEAGEANSVGTPFQLLHHKNVKYSRLLLKTLALRKAACLILQPSSIEFKDERILKEKYPQMWNAYQDCVDEIDRIKSTKFINRSGTFFELLTKCQCQLVEFVRYREFVTKFRLYDLSVFPLYAEDILEAFDRAESYYRSMLDQENLINEALYDTLPHIIVREIARYAVDCEICEMKKITDASKQAQS